MFEIHAKIDSEFKLICSDSNEIDALAHLADYQAQIGTEGCLFTEVKLVRPQE